MDQRVETTDQFHPENTIPTGDWIWVFGSDLKGRHGKGAAKVARTNFRAAYGVGRGATGNAYAIPTKDEHMQSRSFDDLVPEVAQFLAYASARRRQNFFVTRVGCVGEGLSDEQVGPLFASAPPNCSLPQEWREYVEQYRRSQATAPAARPREASAHV